MPATELDAFGRHVLRIIVDIFVVVNVIVSRSYIFIPNTSASKRRLETLNPDYSE